MTTQCTWCITAMERTPIAMDWAAPHLVIISSQSVNSSLKIVETGSTVAHHAYLDASCHPTFFLSHLERYSKADITGLEPVQFYSFWKSTYGCSNRQVTPFNELEDRYYLYNYRNVPAAIGNVITNTDRDWLLNGKYTSLKINNYNAIEYLKIPQLKNSAQKGRLRL